MGTARAPVVGSGRAPAWIARVRLPQSRSSGSLMAVTVQSGAMTTLPGPLVDPTWLVEHLDASDLRVLEATAWLDAPSTPGKPYDVRSGRAEWETAHIVGSAFADVVHDLA